MNWWFQLGLLSPNMFVIKVRKIIAWRTVSEWGALECSEGWLLMLSCHSQHWSGRAAAVPPVSSHHAEHLISDSSSVLPSGWALHFLARLLTGWTGCSLQNNSSATGTCVLFLWCRNLFFRPLSPHKLLWVLHIWLESSQDLLPV